MDKTEIINMVGYLNLSVTKIQNCAPMLDDPKESENCEQMITESIQEMQKMLNSIAERNTITLTVEKHQDSELEEKRLVSTKAEEPVLEAPN